jgi:hypothetical protein
MSLRLPSFVLPGLVGVLFALSANPMPQQSGRPDMADFPAQATHQGVTIAVVPVFDTPEAERIFGTVAAPTRGGFLPVEFIITNQREETIEMQLLDIAIFSGPDRFEMADAETVARGLYPRPKEKEAEDPTQQKRRRLPLPIPIPSGPKKPPKDKKKEIREEAEADLRRRQLRAALVLPGGFARGYLYFDLRAAEIDVEEATLYIPRVREKKSKKKLTFFEISLKPYALP